MHGHNERRARVILPILKKHPGGLTVAQLASQVDGQPDPSVMRNDLTWLKQQGFIRRDESKESYHYVCGW